MTRNKTIITFLIFTFLAQFLPGAHLSSAAVNCLQLTPSSSEADKDYCRKELAQIEAQLAELIQKQKDQQKQTGTLKGDVNYLNSQINALKTKVKSRALAIAQLKVNIAEKTTRINSLSQRINREHESLAQLIRNTNEFDNSNMVHLMLADSSVSDFYSDVETYATLKQAIKDSVDILKGVKTEAEIAKEELERRQDAELDAKAELETAEKKTSLAEAEKKKLLSISQKNEAEYQRLAAEKRAQAAKIRAALFPLAGTTTKIDFGTALTYANEASKATGVEPSFLLAILTQESNLGSNVGQCYLANRETGAGIGKNTGTAFPNVMKPMGMPGRKGDVDDFIRITGNLGLDWTKTAISCPIAGVAGYGGAMGPAQFIPSTWSLFETRLKNTLGRAASPWAPRDAFYASAMYLTDLGAVGTSASAQHKAACKYYGSGGATCGYSNSVMNHKAKIQANIDLLQ